MGFPSFADFLKLSTQGNVIPVYEEVNADVDTPVSALLKLKKDAYVFLLESVEGQEKIARYSFLGSNPSLVLKSKGRDIELAYPHEKKVRRYTTSTTPLDEIKMVMKDFRGVPVAGLPRFYGGLVGFMGYDVVRFFERLPDKNPDDLAVPDAIFMLTDTLLIFDHVNHTLKIISNVILPSKGKATVSLKKRFYVRALKKIKKIRKEFELSLAQKEETSPTPKAARMKLESNFTKRRFCQAVRKAKEYIRKGDIIQVVLSQRFKARIEKDTFQVYRSLRSLNPSPYMFFLKFKGLTLIGSSPEMLVRCEDGLIQTRPIAGTKPRGKTEALDEKFALELLNDKKERAEHLMLVDLGRNDVGRVSATGKVGVHEFMKIERYSHVMHLVSEVRGSLDEARFDIYEVLKAAFPAGTVSGSPKIRAMEIIDELEPVRRGPYAGCVGYFSFSHNMDTCITIRTMVVKEGVAYVQAGAGIVADSVPQREYYESVNKAKALFAAMEK